MSKVKYEFNPYTFARISAMKSLLLRKEDYDRIMKMDPSEIIKFMQSGVYRDEINKLSIKYSGINLVENALNQHLLKMMLKLKVISDPSIEYLMDQYLKRYDFWNLKTILRGKLVKASEDEILDMLLPLGSLKLKSLKKLVSKTHIRDILENSRLVDMTNFEDALNEYDNDTDLSKIENLLDYHYYLDSVEFAKRIPRQGRLFREFFLSEFDVYNLKIMLKKIFFKLKKEDVEPYIIFNGKDLSKITLQSLLNKEKLSDFLRELSKTPYRKVIRDLGDAEDPLLRYEVLLESFLYEKSILLYHQHPLTVDLVLGYMFAKEIEVRNLRTIVKSKTLEFTEDYVKKLIIMR